MIRFCRFSLRTHQVFLSDCRVGSGWIGFLGLDKIVGGLSSEYSGFDRVSWFLVKDIGFSSVIVGFDRV